MSNQESPAEFRPEFEFNEVFAPVFTTRARYIDIWGGRGGGRSHFGSDYFLFKITQPAYFRGCFLRNVAADIRESLFQDFKDRIETSDFEEEEFDINESKMSITHRATGNTIISKGFKKSSSNRSAKLKSLAGITHVLLEEADENSEADVNKLDDSIRTNRIQDIQIILLHNAPSKNHWITRRFYNLGPATDMQGNLLLDQDGNEIPYYRATPKQNPDVLCIFSNYESNWQNLNEKTLHKYREYGNPESIFYNEEHYYVEVLGLIPEGAIGRIYKGWIPITDEFFNSLPYPVYYGLDWGFAGDPLALIAIKSHLNRNFYKQVLYEHDLTDSLLAKRMTEKGVKKNADIYADPSQPKSIKELQDLGFKRLVAADGGADSVLFGIKQVKAKENYLTEGSKETWIENEEYKWKADKEDGHNTEEPVDKFNHAKDAIRYGVTSHKSKKRKNKVTVANTSTETIAPTEAERKKNLLDYI